MTAQTRVAVLGAGSWGTALAIHLANNGISTVLWGRGQSEIDNMRRDRRNQKFLPDAQFPESLELETDLATAISGADFPLIVTPSHAFAELIAQLAKIQTVPRLAWATKGFEPGTGRFLHEVAEAEFGEDLQSALVTGPSFAKEVAAGLPTALTVHSQNEAFAQTVAECLHGLNLRAYTGNDILGAELGGAMKNVLAVATGVADGMQLGLNARAGLITRGLNEMLRLCVALGGKSETMMGLAGLGDLVLTSTGDLSRNRRLGLALGRGASVKQAVADIGQVVESVQTVDEVMRLARRLNIELPISEQVQRVLCGEITPKEGLQNLLARELKPEYPQADD